MVAWLFMMLFVLCGCVVVGWFCFFLAWWLGARDDVFVHGMAFLLVVLCVVLLWVVFCFLELFWLSTGFLWRV